MFYNFFLFVRQWAASCALETCEQCNISLKVSVNSGTDQKAVIRGRAIADRFSGLQFYIDVNQIDIERVTITLKPVAIVYKYVQKEKVGL